MVKKAFLDLELTTTLSLTSANSINIARLIPQTFYYFRGYAQVKNKSLPTVFSVPSGNFGNATAGLIAKKMGLPYHKLVISTNANDIVPQYLDSGEFTPRASVATISNAMDIGNPSNFARIINLYLNREQLLSEMSGASFSDDQTREAIKKAYHSDNYILDPHTAVAYLGLNKFYGNDQNINKIALSTAHPSKFVEIVQDVLKIEVEIPERLACLRDKKKVSTVIKADYQHLKDYLLS
jgi:threonine synthase